MSEGVNYEDALELAHEQFAGCLAAARGPQRHCDYALAVIPAAGPDASQPVEARQAFGGERLLRGAIVPATVEHMHGVAGLCETVDAEREAQAADVHLLH